MKRKLSQNHHESNRKSRRETRRWVRHAKQSYLNSI